DLNHSIPVAGTLEMPDAAVPLDPYLLGLWLGDGSAAGGALTADYRNGDIEWYEAAFRAAGFTTNRYSSEKTFGVPGLAARLEAVGVLRNKHVPPRYLWAGSHQRLGLLQGLMGSDGYAESRQCFVEFTSTNRALADAVLFLARSLSQRPTLSEGRAMLYGQDCGPKYRVMWSPTIEVFLLPRKRALLRDRRRHGTARRLHRMIIDYESIPPVPMRCLEVDARNALFLAGEGMIPTHNSRIA